MEIWLAVSTNGDSTGLCQKWNDFSPLAQVRVGLIVLGGEISLERRCYSSFVVTIRLFHRGRCAITAKFYICLFLYP